MSVHQCDIEDQDCPEIAVAVLAGGESRRFGADKALFRIFADGPTLLECVVQAGLSVTSNVFVVGHRRYESLPIEVPILPDLQPGCGPLAAIRSAMLHSRASRLLVLACDAPCLSPPLLQWMANRTLEAEILIAQTPDGRRQPMPGVYRRSLEGTIEGELALGNRSISSILDKVAFDLISEATLRELDPGFGSFLSLNHPQQLSLIRRCALCK